MTEIYLFHFLSLSHHHSDELFVVDVTITINISLSDHLIDFLISQFLTKGGHDLSELSGGDELVSISIEDLEGFSEFFLGIGVLDLSGHQGEELWEIDGSVSVSIDLVDHVLELGLCGVLAEGAHDGTKLLGGDGAIAILIEQGEGLLEPT